MIGILAIQGDYMAHAKILAQLKVAYCLVISAAQLENCDGLIIPGGESPTILNIILQNGLFAAIKNFHAGGKQIFGTCAGAILLAKKTINPEQKSMGLIDVTIKRNAYGRQLQSHIAIGKNLINNKPQEMILIRAPKIIEFGARVKVLVTYKEDAACAQENNCLITTFHPELTDDLFWHQYFVETMCR